MIRQICYLSTACPGFDQAALTDILATSEHYNAASRVSGLLAYGQGIFFQVIEGPRDSVGATLQRIRRDKRHRGLIVLQDEMIDGRDFEDWRMAFRELDQDTVEEIAAASFVDEGAIPAILAGLVQPLAPRTFRQRVAYAA